MVDLPAKGADPIRINAHGKTLVIRKAASGRDWVATLGGRVRWGRRCEMAVDIAYFLDTGGLPPKGESW